MGYDGTPSKIKSFGIVGVSTFRCEEAQWKFLCPIITNIALVFDTLMENLRLINRERLASANRESAVRIIDRFDPSVLLRMKRNKQMTQGQILQVEIADWDFEERIASSRYGEKNHGKSIAKSFFGFFGLTGS